MNYYSFKLGRYDKNINEWVLLDLKIPASSVVEAIILYYIVKSIFNVKIMAPSQTWVYMKIRQVIEYERLYTPDRGYTIHQYKKKKIYNSHNILPLFETHGPKIPSYLKKGL